MDTGLFLNILGKGKSLKYPLKVGQNFVGRWISEDDNSIDIKINIDDKKISRKHCCFEVSLSTNNSYDIVLFDTNSTNGTYVQGFYNWPLSDFDALWVDTEDTILIGELHLKIINESEFSIQSAIKVKRKVIRGTELVSR